MICPRCGIDIRPWLGSTDIEQQVSLCIICGGRIRRKPFRIVRAISRIPA